MGGGVGGDGAPRARLPGSASPSRQTTRSPQLPRKGARGRTGGAARHVTRDSLPGPLRRGRRAPAGGKRGVWVLPGEWGAERSGPPGPPAGPVVGAPRAGTGEGDEYTADGSGYAPVEGLGGLGGHALGLGGHSLGGPLRGSVGGLGCHLDLHGGARGSRLQEIMGTGRVSGKERGPGAREGRDGLGGREGQAQSDPHHPPGEPGRARGRMSTNRLKIIASEG